VTWGWAVLAPLPLQAAAMLADELHFHRARGLPRWERIGHPLDTSTMLACIAWTLIAEPGARAIAVYVVLAAVSCLFVTKDEFVHTRRCGAGEHWLHAVLFVLHPLCLGAIGVLWLASRDQGGMLGEALPAPAFAASTLAVQLALTSAFGLYQVAYWNLPWNRRQPPAT
jgi:hypothetical protein